VIVAALDVQFAMGPSPDVGRTDVGFQGLVFDQLDARLPKGTRVTLENCFVGTPGADNRRLEERELETPRPVDHRSRGRAASQDRLPSHAARRALHGIRGRCRPRATA
jgi:hypothetical protein